jgi:amidase
LGRTVADVRLGLQVMAEYDWRDPWQVPVPLQGAASDTPIRVAVAADPIGMGVDPAVSEAIDIAASHLSDAGYAVETASPPQAAEIAKIWHVLIGTEAQVLMAKAEKTLGSDDFQQVFRDSFAATPPLDIEGYLRATALRTRHRRMWAAFLQDYPLILMPVSSAPPLPQGEDLKGPDRMADMMNIQAPMYVLNYLGLPASGVPTGLHGDLPMGVQIVGQPFREDMCLDAAQAIEDRVGILTEQLWARED